MRRIIKGNNIDTVRRYTDSIVHYYNIILHLTNMNRVLLLSEKTISVYCTFRKNPTSADPTGAERGEPGGAKYVNT